MSQSPTDLQPQHLLFLQVLDLRKEITCISVKTNGGMKPFAMF